MKGHEVPIHLLGTPLSCVTRHDRCRSIYTYSGFTDQDLWCCLHHFPAQNLVAQKHKIWCKNWYVNVIFNIFKVLTNEGERLLGSFHFSFVFLMAQDSAKIKLPLNVMLCKEFMDLLFFFKFFTATLKHPETLKDCLNWFFLVSLYKQWIFTGWLVILQDLNPKKAVTLELCSNL